MRLRELIEPTVSQTKISSTFSARKASDPRRSGVYAAVRGLRSDPNMVEKYLIMPSDLSKDAYYKYITAIKDQMAGNPHFPRVYRIKIVTDQDGDTRLSYVMERLAELDESSPKIISLIYEKTFGELGNWGNISPLSASNKWQMWDEIVIAIQNSVSSSDFSEIKDEELIKALKLIIDLKEKNNLSYDLFSTNFLIRPMGKFGPDIVIADPLSDILKSIVPERPRDKDIIKNPAVAAEYAIERGKPWPRAEPHILKDLSAAIGYGYKVKQGKWPELEDLILREKNPSAAAVYAIHILQRRWPEAERLIQQDPDQYQKYRNHFRML